MTKDFLGNSMNTESDTRRDVIKKLMVVIAGSTASLSLASGGVRAAVAVPETEGIFLFAEDEDRLFFIRSVWLPYFEVTDKVSNLPDVMNWRGHGKSKKWSVLYSDDIIDTKPTVIQPESGEELPPPSANSTYIAMSLTGGP
jgi:hypothetical protein